MSGVVNYQLPTGFLPAVSIELDGTDPLYGLMTDLEVTVHGNHQVFPYATYSGST